MSLTLVAPSDMVSLIRDLLEIELDAIDAYLAAIRRIRDPDAATRLREFVAVHHRQVRDLAECMRQHGGRPPTDGDFERVLSRGRGMIVGLVDDRAILAVIVESEADAEAAYEACLADLADVGDEETGRLREVVNRGLEDGRRHTAWLQQAILALQAHLRIVEPV